MSLLFLSTFVGGVAVSLPLFYVSGAAFLIGVVPPFLPLLASGAVSPFSVMLSSTSLCGAAVLLKKEEMQ